MADHTELEVIHRLKNHIAVIVGFCDLVIADMPESDTRRGDMLEIQKAAYEAMAMMPEVARCAELRDGRG